jgi:hypothetical protein
METTNNNMTELVKVSEAGLLSLVASLIEGVVLFPEKMEDAKDYLNNLQPAQA